MGCGILLGGDIAVSGVMLRSTGVAWDLRLSTPSHPVVPVGTDGDSMDRVVLRCIEVLSTVVLLVLLVATVVSSTASTSVSSYSLHGVLSLFMVWRYMVHSTTTTTHSVEGPKGELSVALTSTVGRVWRCRLRPADLHHILCMQSLVLGTSLADVVLLSHRV
jgi:NADH-quinone oxidoreductase subunit D